MAGRNLKLIGLYMDRLLSTFSKRRVLPAQCFLQFRNILLNLQDLRKTKLDKHQFKRLILKLSVFSHTRYPFGLTNSGIKLYTKLHTATINLCDNRVFSKFQFCKDGYCLLKLLSISKIMRPKSRALLGSDNSCIICS